MFRSAHVILILLILLLASCVTTDSPPENAVPFEEKYDHLLQFPGGTFSPEATDAAVEDFFLSHPSVIRLAYVIPGGEQVVAEKKVRGRKDSFLQYSGGKFQESSTFEGLSAYMDRYQEIFEITIAFPDGSGTGRSYREPITQRGGEPTLAWLEGRNSGPEPEEQGKTLPDDAWYADPGQAVLLMEEGQFVLRNRQDGREKVLCTYEVEWRDRQEQEGTVGMTIGFTDASGGVWERLEMNVGMYEKRSRNTGGWSTQSIEPGRMTIDIEDEVPRYPIEHYFLQDGKVTFINGNTVKSLSPVGDRNNPFSLTRFQGEPAADWFSDEEQATLILEDGIIRAVRKDGGESKDLVKVVTTWKLSGRPLRERQFFITFQDLTWGKVLGGSAEGSVRGWGFGPGWNILKFAYRFDGGDVNHGYYDYNPGALPSVSYTIKSEEGNTKRAEESLLLTGGTLAFKDGHVLEIGVPEE